MSLGDPRTSKYKIGTAEVRVGTLANANKLKPADSVGLLDNVTVEVTQNSVDLLGGFPRFLADTAIVSQEAQVTATLREYSRRNMRLMFGEGIGTEPTDDESLITTSLAVDGTSFDVTATEGSKFSAGSIITIYKEGVPENVTVARVASVTTDTVTLDADTPSLFAYDGTVDTIKVVLAHPVAIGGLEKTNYFALQVIEAERATGRPVVWNFWKASLASGMTVATNAEDFASMEFVAKILKPAAAEYGAGGDLVHLADIIPDHEMGMYAGGGD